MAQPTEWQLETQFQVPRDTIFRLLQNDGYQQGVVDVMMEVFKAFPDTTVHGYILWALMAKAHQPGTPTASVLGLHLKVYLQYYYLALVTGSQRRCNRTLTIADLAFLVAVAAFGYHRGSQEFEKAFQQGNIASINQMVVTRDNFVKFFWAGDDDNFSFLHSWRLIDQLWDLWDIRPLRIHGYISPNIADAILKRRLHRPGAFLLRFSSRGGLAVDYVRNGRVEKTHWKFSALKNSTHLKSKLYDQNCDGPYLTEVVAGEEPLTVDLTLSKLEVFPLLAQDNAYVDAAGAASGYVNVDDTMGDVPQVAGYISMNDTF